MFPVHYFDGYDYDRPCSLLELVPVTTQEVKAPSGQPTFPCKEAYDRYRNFPVAMLPSCIIRPADHDVDLGAVEQYLPVQLVLRRGAKSCRITALTASRLS